MFAYAPKSADWMTIPLQLCMTSICFDEALFSIRLCQGWRGQLPVQASPPWRKYESRLLVLPIPWLHQAFSLGRQAFDVWNAFHLLCRCRILGYARLDQWVLRCLP